MVASVLTVHWDQMELGKNWDNWMILLSYDFKMATSVGSNLFIPACLWFFIAPQLWNSGRVCIIHSDEHVGNLEKKIVTLYNGLLINLKLLWTIITYIFQICLLHFCTLHVFNSIKTYFISFTLYKGRVNSATCKYCYRICVYMQYTYICTLS